jgi:tetratricopeptide (TPR) repeat protein
MKKIIFALTILVSVSLFAQSSAEVDLEVRKMKLALSYGDKEVALSKMYNIIAIEGAQSVYKDSLVYLYFNNRNYLSCFLVSKDVIDRKPDNIEILEMNTISLESIGAKAKAAEGYNSLLTKTNKGFHAYKLASLQFETNALEDAYVSIKKADSLPNDESVSISFQVNPKYNQDIQLKPAIAYLQGLIAVALKKNAAAKAAFERAILLFPEFVLAKSQLSALKEQE